MTFFDLWFSSCNRSSCGSHIIVEDVIVVVIVDIDRLSLSHCHQCITVLLLA